MRRNRSAILSLSKEWLILVIAVISLLVVVVFRAGLTRATSALTSGNITHVWANEGGDKVTRDELRATDDPRSHTNLFQQAQTFGCYSYDSDTRGQAGRLTSTSQAFGRRCRSSSRRSSSTA